VAFLRNKPETLAELLSAHAAERPDQTAYRFLVDGRDDADSVTYSRLDLRARAVAAAIQQVCAPGERALVLSDVTADFVLAFMGCQHAGVIAVPVAPPLAAGSAHRIATLAAIVRDCGATTVLSSSGSGLLKKLRVSTPELAGLEWIDVDTVPESVADAFQPVSTGPEDLSFLQYTSGSTSLPKGVMVSHRMLMHNEEFFARCLDLGPDDVFVSWLPLFHDMGLIGNVLQSFYIGAQAVLMTPTSFVRQPSRWLRAFTDYRGTVAGSPNFGYDLCVERIPEAERAGLDLSSWKAAYNGAEPVRTATLTAFAKAFKPYGFDPRALSAAYGLAETTLLATVTPADVEPTLLSVDADALRSGKVLAGADRVLIGAGRAEYFRRIEIVDPNTRLVVEPGRVGEVWLAGPDVSAGYWNRPEESERTMHARLADSGDGPFLRTGDLGALHEDELFITGRLKDTIIVDGRNHYPQDIEATVEARHPEVRANCVAAFSVERDDREQVVLVAELTRRGVVSTPDGPAQLDFRQLTRRIRTSVVTEHGIALHEVVLAVPGSVPKTSSGKLQRAACRLAYERGELASKRLQ
jgi:acyl-CoA synthetase (AMP-forming)/AMP-acid ligase II